MATLHVRGLGEYIRDQRVLSQVSLRQLARQAGVSNPYLSQIERGLRKPSAEILQQIAKALRISAEALYVQAGILDERDAEGTIPTAVLADATITERQKHVLLEIYDSFRRENDAKAPLAEAATVAGDAAAAVTAPAKRARAAVERVAAPVKRAVGTPASPATTQSNEPVSPSAASPSTAAESGAAEPTKTGLAKTGPAEAGSAKVGPTKAGPAKAGPTKTGPVKAGPVKAGPVKKAARAAKAPRPAPPSAAAIVAEPSAETLLEPAASPDLGTS